MKTEQCHKISPCGSSEKICRFAWGGVDNLRQLGAWLYPAGDYLCLDRKRQCLVSYLAELDVRRGSE